jgi:hypothetical protein
MISPIESPLSARKLFVVIAIVFSLIIFVIFLLTSTGVFDPRPIGPLSADDNLRLRVTVEDTYLSTVPHQPSSNEFSVRLKASWVRGDADSGYGLAIGDGPRNVIVALSPTGYTTITKRPAEGEISHNDGSGIADQKPEIPWRIWPHVKTGTHSNEIWLDIVDQNLVTVRINRELLWEGSLLLPGTNISLWAQSFGETADIEFTAIELFQETPE